MEIGKRFNLGIFWYGIFTIVSRGANVLLLLFFSKKLSISFFGQISYIHTTINIFISLVVAGFLTVLSKSVSEFRNTNPIHTLKYIYNLFCFFLIIFFIVLILGYLLRAELSILLFSSISFSIYVPYIILIIVANSLILFSGSVLIGLEEFRLNSILQGVFSILLCAFQILFTIRFGFLGYIYSSLIFSVLFIFPMFYFTYRVKVNKIGTLTFGKLLDHAIIIEQLKNGSSIFFSNLLVGFTQWYIMTNFRNEYNFEEVGKLNLINTIRSLLLLFPSIVYSASLPILSNLWGESEKLNHNKMINFSFHLLSKCSILLLCIILIFSDTILNYFGHEQLNIPFQLFLLATVFSAIGGTFGNALTSLGKYWYGFLINLIFALITIVSYLILRHKGILAVSLAYFISYFASLFYAFYLLYVSDVVNKSNVLSVLKYSGIAILLVCLSLISGIYSTIILLILGLIIAFNLFNFLKKNVFSYLD